MKRLLIISAICLASAYCHSEAEEDMNTFIPERLRNVTCQNSKLVVEERPDATYIKLIADSGEVLLNVNSLYTKASRIIDKLIMDTTDVLFPEDNYIPGLFLNSTAYYMTYSTSTEGITVKLENKLGVQALNTLIPPQAGVEPSLPKPTCAHIRHLDLIVDPSWDINGYDGYNMTSLLWSCVFGLTDLAKSLVERGANPNQVGYKYITPLFGAIRSNRDDLAQFLVQKGANVNLREGEMFNFSPLEIAAFKGRLSIARMLVEHGSAVDSSENLSRMTPLLLAASKGHLGLVDFLLQKGANAKAANIDGQSALHLAVLQHSNVVAVIRRLVEGGADINSKDGRGQTPLMLLAASKTYDQDDSYEVVEYLLNHQNPDVNAKDQQGKTALSLAKDNGFSRIEELIRAKGAV